MKTFSALDDLVVSDVRYIDVPVPEWGVQVRLRSLTALEHERIDRAATLVVKRPDGTWAREQNIVGLRVRTIMAALVDQENRDLVNEKNEKLFEAKLSSCSSFVIQRLYSELMAMSGASPAEVTKAGEASGSGPSGDSPTA